MAPGPLELEIRAGADGLYRRLQPAYRETLVSPQDDMWAAFADGASHHALRVGGEIAGCCSVNDAGELMFFHLDPRFDDRAETVFAQVISHLELVAANPSTVDPGFLALCLDAGCGLEARALLYRHVVEVDADAPVEMRATTVDDHAAAIGFVEGATGFPRAFLEPYLMERIEKGQLLLYETAGSIRATGECRDDERQPGFAHVGLIVGRDERGRGLGGRVMHALVAECRRRELEPLCSTEPENLAARAVIQRAGFRSRHRVYRVALA